MASIHRLPHTQYWYASYRAGGRQHLRSTKQTDRTKATVVAINYEKAAKLADAQILTEAQARDVLNYILKASAPSEQLRAPQIGKFLIEWLENKEAARSAGTGARYRHVVEEFIKHLGNRVKRPLSSLAPSDIQSFLTKRTKAGCSPTTVNLDGKVLRTALNFARRQGLVTTNVAEAVELPEAESVERGTFSAGDVRLLVDAAEGEWKTIILLGYFTGARLGDCCNMRWDGVDLAAGTLAYTQQKTGKEVLLPLHTELAAHLDSIAVSDRNEQYLSPHMAGLKPGGRHGLSEGFKRIVRNAGLDLQTVQGYGTRNISRRTFHALRHSFTSALANANVAPELRMKLTGHTSEATHRGYSHLELAVLRKAMSKLPGLTSPKKQKRPKNPKNTEAS
jgi:integrase